MDNKISIITGGTSGLGFEIAKNIVVNRKRSICIVGRNEDRLHKATEKLHDFNQDINILTIKANIGIEKDVSKVFDSLKNYDIDQLYNNAGVGRFGSPDSISGDIINEVFSANLVGLILMTSYGLRNMNSEENYIVNIMSTAAHVSRPKESVYCAAKWGARGFTEALKAATKGTNYRVISVYPGGMNTPFWSEECGLNPDTSKFMSPGDVADKIVNLIFNVDSTVITDIVLNRR